MAHDAAAWEILETGGMPRGKLRRSTRAVAAAVVLVQRGVRATAQPGRTSSHNHGPRAARDSLGRRSQADAGDQDRVGGGKIGVGVGTWLTIDDALRVSALRIASRRASRSVGLQTSALEFLGRFSDLGRSEIGTVQ